MAKQNDKEVKSTRKELITKNEKLENLLELRRKGILTRQQFRLLTFDKGLQGSTKGSPLIEMFELEKKGKGKPVLVQKVRQWTRT